METCFSSNIAGGSPTLKSYMETRLKWYIHCMFLEFAWLTVLQEGKTDLVLLSWKG